eukprot:GFUD01014340.1.p1 GENE.GFUD01014340.1~~GFUD01014340.1.p1  ORF type:complete len:703 (-),score=114.52 GFUD01014340.1:88-2196(-)
MICFKLKFAVLLPFLGQCVSQTLPPWQGPCCPSKQVGGIKYTLAMTGDYGDTSSYGCFDSCIYSSLESPGENFCFKKGNLPAMCNSNKCPKVITRQNVSSLTTGNFSAFNEALRKMKEDTTKEGFIEIGAYHGLPYRCSTDQRHGMMNGANGCCIDHWSQASKRENFMTWHRLFTYNLEYSMNQHSAGALAMPYWDWTSSPTSDVILPALALQGEWTNGPKPSPPGGVTSRTFPTSGVPKTTDYFRGLVKTSFKQTNYVQFNQQIVLPHNLIHGLVGGDMGAPYYASYDPIFYLHHSYVDLQFAFYQELQRLRHINVTKKSFCKQGRSAALQPFASPINPYAASKLNSIGYQTLDYENNFCYKFDELLFEGLTPAQFLEREEEEMQHPSILAAVAMITTGYPSTVVFDLFSPTDGSLATGVFHTLGKGQDPDFSQYNSFTLTYFDFTDILFDSTTVSDDRTLKINVTDVSNGSLESAYQPMVVFRPGGSRQHTYRIHTADIALYAPVMHGQPGAKLQFLNDDGTRTTDEILEYINNADGIEVGIPINNDEDQEIKYNEHKYHHSATNTTVTLGHAQYFECDQYGDPVCDPEYFKQGADAVTVVHWDTNAHSQYVTALTGQQILLLAWCHGQYANVNEVSKDDYDNCTNLNPTNAREGPASYLVNTDTAGTFYFASGVSYGYGVPNACQEGWKITVEVKPPYQ